jgi:hypothetical protein
MSEDGTHESSSTYRLSTSHVLRALGPVLIGLGVVWVVAALVSPWPPLRWLLGVATLVVAGIAAVGLLRPPTVLRLSLEGYRVSFVRGVGAAEAAWSAVETAGTERRSGTPCLRITLTDGRTSVIPLSLLGTRSGEAQRDVHVRLNEAHGYRRL